MEFSFEEPVRGNRYNNSRMDNNLAGDMSQGLPEERSLPPPPPPSRRNNNTPAPNEDLYDTITEQNTRQNSKIGYDPTEFMLADESMLKGKEEQGFETTKYTTQILLALILFFQIFIVFKLFFSK